MKTRAQIESMSREERRVATAELMGAKWFAVPKEIRNEHSYCPSSILAFERPEFEGNKSPYRRYMPPIAQTGKSYVDSDVPDYLQCLNAMHEAIQSLSDKQKDGYRLNLLSLCRDQDLEHMITVSTAIDATAEQRNLAFLMVMLP